MVCPSLLAGIVERSRLSSIRINAVYERPFVGIAVRAGQREIRQDRFTLARTGDDMINRKCGDLPLNWDATVLATVAGTGCNLLAKLVRDQGQC
jgi:hypothetical protein